MKCLDSFRPWQAPKGGPTLAVLSRVSTNVVLWKEVLFELTLTLVRSSQRKVSGVLTLDTFNVRRKD